MKHGEFGLRVPGHTILSRLRGGGMASVFLAREDRLGRLVAIKVIDERYARQPTLRKRFEREARTAASLSHPNIVPIYQYGFTNDSRPFLTMPFVEDGSLGDRLRKRAPLPVDEALAVTRQIASGLLVAHGRNVVHRDLKPDNVLFQGDTAMLTDFGIAKVLDADTDLTEGDANPGTVRYFSPEQAREQAVDARSDIYALGVVLYEMLTGDVPIDGDSVVQLMLHIAHAPPRLLPMSLAPLQPLLDVLLAKDPAERFSSCAEIIAVLQSMEQNWARYGEVERLTVGVTLARPGNGVKAHVLGPDATTLVFARARADRVAEADTAVADGPTRSHVRAVDGDDDDAAWGEYTGRHVPAPRWVVAAAAATLLLAPIGLALVRPIRAQAPEAVVPLASAPELPPDQRPGVAVISRATTRDDAPPARYVGTDPGP